MSNFNLYSEPYVFQWLVFISNTFVYAGLWFSSLHVFRLALFHKNKVILSNWGILAAVGVITLLNMYLHIYIGAWGFMCLFLTVAYLSWKWIDRKSLRWTNISLALFFLFTLGMYTLFNTKIQTITYPFFSYNDLVEYKMDYKPYFQIYMPSDEYLTQISFSLSGKWEILTNQPVGFRTYLFYYFMQSSAIIFWMIIFFDVLKKHVFFYSRHLKGLNEYYSLFYAPSDISWKSFLIPTIREKELNERKIQKKLAKNGIQKDKNVNKLQTSIDNSSTPIEPKLETVPSSVKQGILNQV